MYTKWGCEIEYGDRTAALITAPTAPRPSAQAEQSEGTKGPQGPAGHGK